jgi:hypothetical protein
LMCSEALLERLIESCVDRVSIPWKDHRIFMVTEPLSDITYRVKGLQVMLPLLGSVCCNAKVEDN